MPYIWRMEEFHAIVKGKRGVFYGEIFCFANGQSAIGARESKIFSRALLFPHKVIVALDSYPLFVPDERA